MTQGRTVKWLTGGAVVISVLFVVVWAADLWSRLGVTEARAKTASVRAFAEGQVPFYLAAKAVMAAPPPARAALVVEGLGWVRSFAGSAEFKAAYTALRQDLKPAAPVSKGTPEQRVKAQQDEQRRGIEEAKKSLATLSPEIRKQVEAMINQMEAAFKKSSTDPQMVALAKTMAEADDKQTQDRYRADLATWEQAYPADGSALVASRLRQFLDACGDVDYAAKLASRNGKMRFAEQRYEEKPPEWKLCYRAGRETTEAARSFAKTWLGQLTKK